MRIGELAAAGGTTTKTVRFYEQQGLMPEPARTPGGYRDYGPDHIARLKFIRRLQAAGLSLVEVRPVLNIVDRDEAPCGHVEQILRARLDQIRAQIAELLTLETHLTALLSTDQRPRSAICGDQSPICEILEALPGTG